MSVPPDSPASPPRWMAPWLAASPAMYLLSPLALLALPYLRTLPQPVLWILGFYALSQQLPALFSPEPLLASATALVRTALMFGLIGVGVALKDSQRLRPLAIGLAIIYATALIFSVVGGNDFLISRLTHPYMTPIALGLAGAFGVWMALFVHGHLLWRVPLGLFAIVVLLLSGSRGPLAAALVGCVAGLIVQRGRNTAVALLLGAGVLLGGFYVGDRMGISAISRLGSADTTGRDIVWYNTLTVIQSEPWSGVGSYRLGKYLAPPSEKCPVVTTLADNTSCPEWISNLGSPWLIAHNLTLQQLAETGPLGLLGLGLLLTVGVAASIFSREPFETSIVSGLIVTTFFDNSILLPSPFFAEIFWVVVGIRMSHLSAKHYMYVVTGKRTLMFSVILSFSLTSIAYFPLILTSVARKPTNILIDYIYAPQIYSSNYKLFIQPRLPVGSYRIVFQSCKIHCSTIQQKAFSVYSDDSMPLIPLGGRLNEKSQNLQLLIYPENGTTQALPLAELRWILKR